MSSTGYPTGTTARTATGRIPIRRILRGGLPAIAAAVVAFAGFVPLFTRSVRGS